MIWWWKRCYALVTVEKNYSYALISEKLKTVTKCRLTVIFLKNLTHLQKGDQIMAKGKPWHPACYAALNAPIVPVVEPSLEKSGRPLLETDFPLLREVYPDCYGCKTPITDVSLNSFSLNTLVLLTN
jgi:hypothetical protein